MNNYINPEILRIVKKMNPKAFDRNQQGPKPSDFGQHLEIPAEAVLELPINPNEPELPEDVENLFEQLPVPKGLLI